MKRIVLLAGFEAFNAGLYRQAAEQAMAQCPELSIAVFSDRDLSDRPADVAAALEGADAFFASLIFDFDQVEWLRQHAVTVPIRLVFESAIELMELTRFGRFTIGGSSAGMPRPIQALLAKFGSGREEDKLAGYIGFLKVGPKLLRFLPFRKAQDLRHWLILYGYWNAGGSENVAALFLYLARHGLGLRPGAIPPPRESPNLGLVHPDHDGFFLSPREYLAWFHQTRPQSAAGHGNWPVVGLLLYRKHVITAQPYLPQLIRAFEDAELVPLPVFINGVEGHMAVRDWMTSATELATAQVAEQTSEQTSEAPASGARRDAVAVDAIVSTIGFPLVGGPAGSMEAGRREEVAQRILRAKNVPYLVSAPLLIQDLHSWTRQGIGGLQSVVLFALPELDGAIDPVPLGGLVGDRIYLIPERLRRLTGRLKAWIALRRKLAAERRLAIVLYGFPPGYGATGTAALLNVPDSLMAVLKALAAEGYDVGPLPASGEELIRQVKDADDAWVARIPEGQSFEDTGSVTVTADTLRQWLGPLHTARIEKQWGPLTATGIRTLGDRFLLGGVRLGKVWIGVQPPLGVAGDPMRLMYERDLTPHPQYAAFYGWLQHGFKADAVLHFGMHGTVEWLPGSPLGNTGTSWPDLLLGHLPHLYVYAANNPSESMLAKRRGYGVIVSHNVPPYGRAGLYRELIALRELIAEYREDPERNEALREGILKQVSDSGLDADCPAPGNVRTDQGAFHTWVVRLSGYLQLLESRLFSSGLHTLGLPPDQEQRLGYLRAYVGDALEPELLEAISRLTPAADQPMVRAQAAELEHLHPGLSAEQSQRLLDALTVCQLLERSTEEIDHLLDGLGGAYIPPAPGGDLLRDGPGVLPTGRNIHALDPYRMPSPGAMVRGRAIALRILEKHRSENGGAWPETVAVMLWGLDAIKTRGESLAILLELVGAEPVKEGTGRIVRYDLKPLEALDHPRIDVLVNLSGIFRDSFVNIIELLDDLFRRAASADEPEERNAIRRHARALQAQGIDNPTARLFSNPAGDFGSLVNDRVTDANWENGEELASTWQDRNVFSYGRADKGQARPQVLAALLRSTERVVQQIDSVEYGLTDIQEYYANTGGLKRAAEVAQRETKPGGRVAASFVESFSRDTTPRDLEELLRLEYRTKLLNPRWAQSMAAMGSGGAYEISQRMTALVGWGGTSGFRDPWVYDQAADTYAFDAAMAQRLREANPEAFRNVVGRMLEASSRGLWNAPSDKLERLRDLYDLTDAELEGVSVTVGP
ncbi:cobaltochelatase subunit CobN [Synechococcus sp. CCY9201]|uniref:cobaltochelatase subunit CobN n=1 Tax=Synechococcus sp. CCY9201 TaxID=174697 RepID=UPI002B1FD29A|nr:cobaltochelatase subunit CobN [Synechococcus sp. CCY9201]MEA5474535.1 cobaltochelatase subunit CobN [Synechococcus sp. CCY9201]